MSEMTQSIINLRRDRVGYTEIAKRLGIAKHIVVYECKKVGLTGLLAEPSSERRRLDEKTVADYVDRSGFDYVGGYKMAKKPITVRCRVCGRTFERQFHIFRDVVNGTWTAGNECPLCREDRQNEKKEQAERIKRENAEREAQKRIEVSNRKINDELIKRLAIHVCKNCGKEYCQMTTGYNSTSYCSEKCQKRWYNRKALDKRHKRLMAREHDTDISLERLFQRDHGICYLCGQMCDWTDGTEIDGTFIAGLKYPSIDHVVPVSKGGTHTWANIKLAHRECNSKKRDKT